MKITNGFPTLADLAAVDANPAREVIDQTIARAPELENFPAEMIEGSSLTLSVLDELPAVGFRKANEGGGGGAPKFSSKLFQAMIIEEVVSVDKMGISEGSKDPARFLMNWSMPFMRAVMSKIAKVGYYGTSLDEKGFPGLIAQHAAGTDHNVDATGTSGKSSVWFLELGADTLSWVFGNGNTIAMDADWVEETIRPKEGGAFKALSNTISSRVGIKLANKNSAVRIKNVTAQSGKGLTDKLLYQGLERAETLGMQPNLIVANPRSLFQLRDSRDTINQTGMPASLPREWEGIPILSTINISTDEAI